MNTRAMAVSRPTIILALLTAIALSIAFAIRPSMTAAFTAGDNGHPNGGPYSDLNGGSATFTFQQNATLTCHQDSASGFTFHVDYVVSGAPLPSGATLVVYLSPNQGAINGNAGGDEAGYIADVESNYAVLDVAGLSGSGTIDVALAVTTSFQLSSGGVLGVFASELDGQSWNAKTNSLNCTEAEGTPVPTATPTATATATATPTATRTPEQTVEAGTGTPEETQADTAMSRNGVSPLTTIAFVLILLASLGTLAYANVRAVRSHG